MEGPLDPFLQDPFDEKEGLRRRRLKLYLIVGGGVSILIPLLGYAYIRLSDTSKIPVPTAGQVFSHAVQNTSAANTVRKDLPPPETTVLSQNQGTYGSLSYALGGPAYYHSAPPHAPAPKPAPKPMAVLRKPAPPAQNRKIVSRAKPTRHYQPVVPPTLDSSNSGFNSEFGSSGFGSGSGLGQGLSGATPAAGTTSDISSLLKSIPGASSALGGMNLGNLLKTQGQAQSPAQPGTPNPR